MNKKIRLPELLSPAGSPEAFEAAIDGGADAIYVGGASFNARIHAKNFTEEALADAVKLAHTYGVKVYQTVNIMVQDRELEDFYRSAQRSAEIGMDAFIVSDLGAASLLHRALPDMPLHGSTQMSVHNAEGAKLLAEHGFTRVVPARELSKEDIAYMVENNPLEVEIFIHGALCVSHSGQCLFSSLVGGRSGNRGLCAQPCRLPYCAGDRKCGNEYPLSLKDMSLATHVREILESGVASLKIEGRMKSPEYVRGVTKIWRKLLDEARDATREDIEELSALFSRGGFTDGYYTGALTKKMLGVRSEEDKQLSRETERFHKITRKLPVDMQVRLQSNSPAVVTVSYGKHSVTVEGDIPEAAINAPLDEVGITKCMAKLGDSPFVLRNMDIQMTERLMMPVSRLNALRREAVAALSEKLAEKPIYRVEKNERKASQKKAYDRKVGRFMTAEQLTEQARAYFDICLLPLDVYANENTSADGFFMPAVVLDHEKETVSLWLEKAAEKKPTFAVLGNLGQIESVKKVLPDTKLIADFRFNVANDESMLFLEQKGFESTVLSPELTLPQLRDIHGSKSAIVYGRLPLMTLEKCVIKALYGEQACRSVCPAGKALMKDRKGILFPILRESSLSHRNLIFNSLPTYMGDKQDELLRAGITDRHFLFTAESPDEVDCVIEAHLQGASLQDKVRRI